MRIAVFGLGHVGLVLAAVLADFGHQVTGVDINPSVLAEINAGRAPFFEPRLDDLLAKHLGSNCLRLTADAHVAVAVSDMAFVCVGTPIGADGQVDLSAVRRVYAELGASLRARSRQNYVVVLRSTVPPNAYAELSAHLDRAAGYSVAQCVNPEFLREGRAINDLRGAARELIGDPLLSQDSLARTLLEQLYADRGTPVIVTSPENVLLVKYAANAWHALKVVFANEIGSLATHMGAEGDVILDIFCQDRVLNISQAYLLPGGAFGGPCLGKDLAALCALSTPEATPVLDAIARSNERRIVSLCERALSTEAQRLGVVGLSFKSDTSDLRSSPAAHVITTLLNAGRDVRIFDPDVSTSQAGRFAPYLVASWAEMDDWADALVICKSSQELSRRRSDRAIVRWE